MDNQHRKIKGYRELSQAEIDLMNEIKTKGVELGELCRRLNEYLGEQHGDGDREAVMAKVKAEPYRWLAIGKTHIQEGLMALTRAVAQPEFF